MLSRCSTALFSLCISGTDNLRIWRGLVGDFGIFSSKVSSGNCSESPLTSVLAVSFPFESVSLLEPFSGMGETMTDNDRL